MDNDWKRFTVVARSSPKRKGSRSMLEVVILLTLAFGVGCDPGWSKSGESTTVARRSNVAAASFAPGELASRLLRERCAVVRTDETRNESRDH